MTTHTVARTLQVLLRVGDGFQFRYGEHFAADGGSHSRTLQVLLRVGDGFQFRRSGILPRLPARENRTSLFL